jgi:hypothetical protein
MRACAIFGTEAGRGRTRKELRCCDDVLLQGRLLHAQRLAVVVWRYGDFDANLAVRQDDQMNN